jgi:hypothetical protein
MVSCHRLLTAALPAVCRRWGSKPGLIRQFWTKRDADPGAAAALAAARAGIFSTPPASAG